MYGRLCLFKGSVSLFDQVGTKTAEMYDGTRVEVIHTMKLNKEATSMRQSAEWGMRALQGSFPRLTNRFRFEEKGERGIMLKMMVLAYNLRARMVGINQIRNVYMPTLKKRARRIFPKVN